MLSFWHYFLFYYGSGGAIVLNIIKHNNRFLKSLLQTTNVLLCFVLLVAISFIANLLLKTSDYGFEKGLKGALNTFEMLLSPLFSQLIWSSYPKITLYHFFINLLVFYLMVSISFWINNIVIRYFCLILVTIIICGWYYVYILSNAAI
jgi:hypothetical protein